MDSSSNAARSKFQEIIHTKFVSYFITVIFHTAVGDWLLFASVVATCPDLSGDIRIAGLCYIALRRYEEALDTFRFLMNISNSNQHVSNSLIWAYCSNGNFEEAKTLMNELETRSLTEYIAGTYRGISAAYLGNINAAFHSWKKLLMTVTQSCSNLNILLLFRLHLEMIRGFKIY